jgi:hypothetical protein
MTNRPVSGVMGIEMLGLMSKPVGIFSLVIVRLSDRIDAKT